MFKYLCILIIFFASEFALGAEIKWEVDHPFRFLKFKSDHMIHEMAYDAAKAKNSDSFQKNPVSNMEALLNSSSWWMETLDEWDGKPIDLVSKQRFIENRKPNRLDIRLGWSSLLRSNKNGNIFSATCWDAQKQNYFGCRSNETAINGSSQYAHPTAHFVNIKIDGVSRNQRCQLVIENNISSGTGFISSGKKIQSRETKQIEFSCNETILLRIPYKKSLIISGKAGNKSLSKTKIEVRDILIASLGDSFASGEGNPDLIAKLDNDKAIYPRINPDGKIEGGDNYKISATGEKYGVPTRELDSNGKISAYSSARWIDRRCHRSMYSAHTRAAIAISLSGNRHHAVTYLSQACSGAEITDGLFWPQDGRECAKKGRSGTHFLEPQISSLIAALGQSEGGNPNLRSFTNQLHNSDKYKKEVLNKLDRWRGISKIRRKLGKCKSWPGYTEIQEKPLLRTASFKNKRKIDLLMLSFGGNDMGFSSLISSVLMRGTFTPLGDLLGIDYSSLGNGIDLDEARHNIDMLDGRFNMLSAAVKTKLEIKNPKNVLLTSYPSPAYNSEGKFCNSNRKGMNVSRLLDLAGPNEHDGNANIEQAQKIVVQLNKKLKDMASTHKFTFVNNFEDKFRKHGICAQGDKTESKAEIFDIPYKNINTNRWKFFNPISEFYPYAKRQRWFRTFNDSYLAMFHFKQAAQNPSEKFLFSLQRRMSYLAYRTLGGPVHPTAEGHAAVADAIYCSAVKRLFRDESDIQCN